MDRKAAPERPPTSRAGSADGRAGERGIVLIEIVAVLAIIALLAAVILPAIPRATSRAALEAYAIDVATLITQDRNAAVQRRTQVVTQIDAPERLIVSGASGRQLRLPVDIAVDALLAARCGDRPSGGTIRFFPSGSSCGGVVALRRPGTGYQVRVNWLTGGVEVVAGTR
ncbi:MAG TPA: type II secretion system protein GspH [Xanthobacteraceae bacterium]|jgi:general secretion pathway protein H